MLLAPFLAPRGIVHVKLRDQGGHAWVSLRILNGREYCRWGTPPGRCDHGVGCVLGHVAWQGTRSSGYSLLLALLLCCFLLTIVPSFRNSAYHLPLTKPQRHNRCQ